MADACVVSPIHITFSNGNRQYIFQHKDSPTAISISPSLEEDRVIDQSWNEHLERESLVNQNAENQIDKSHELPPFSAVTDLERKKDDQVPMCSWILNR